jgi:Uma2 family endonuclease
MSVVYKRKLFTVDDYHKMINAGILKEDDRVELINGEIIAMPPIGPNHASCVDRVNSQLYLKLGHSIIVRVQSPILLDDYSEPEPDITILKHRSDFYKNSHPKPEDILLIIEIGDSTIEYDRTIKIPGYAKSNVMETWLFDINKDRIELHRRPYNGIYQETRIAQRGQQFSCLSFPETLFSVDELL